MIKVIVKDGESTDRLIKRFLKHVKNRGLLKAFRNNRYFASKPTRKKTRETALSRETYRAERKKKQYIS
jgi:ribosomal protein S21